MSSSEVSFNRLNCQSVSILTCLFFQREWTRSASAPLIPPPPTLCVSMAAGVTSSTYGKPASSVRPRPSAVVKEAARSSSGRCWSFPCRRLHRLHYHRCHLHRLHYRTWLLHDVVPHRMSSFLLVLLFRSSVFHGLISVNSDVMAIFVVFIVVVDVVVNMSN